jgi:hypothetical protein
MIISITLLILNLGLFILGLFVASTDAQGSFVFILFVPLMLLFSFIALLRAKNRGHKLLIQMSLGSFFIVIGFVFTSAVPFLNFIPKAMVSGVSAGFESLTGETPYAWTRKRNDVVNLIQEEIKDQGGKRMDLSRLPLALKWERVCVLETTLDDELAKKLVRLDFKFSEFVSPKSHVFALVFVRDKNQTISYVVTLPPEARTLANYSGKCFPREEASFTI